MNTTDFNTLAKLKFGRLKPIRLGPVIHMQRRIVCLCDCGQEHTVTLGNLRKGGVKSCGCLKRELLRAKLTEHGKTRTKIYRIWQNMLSRCQNSKVAAYKNYGGRGIQVCDHWKTFSNFYADMGEPRPGTLLERKDNNGNYEPKNCCWATLIVQANNTRRNRHVSIDGEIKTIAEWAREYGLSQQTLRTRIVSGRTGFSMLLCPPRNSIPS